MMKRKTLKDITRIIPPKDLLIIKAAYADLAKRVVKVPEYPAKEMQVIAEKLKKMQKAGWLSRQDYDAFTRNIDMQVYYGNGEILRHNLGIMNLLGKHRGSPPKDLALNICCFALVYAARTVTTFPRYSLICKWLEDQKLAWLTEADLKQKIQNKNITEVCRQVLLLSALKTSKKQIPTRSDRHLTSDELYADIMVNRSRNKLYQLLRGYQARLEPQQD